MSIFSKKDQPALVSVKFDPQPNITAYELAVCFKNNWPVIVDTASGEGVVLTSFDVRKDVWDTVHAGIKRHFKVLE